MVLLETEMWRLDRDKLGTETALFKLLHSLLHLSSYSPLHRDRR